VGVQGFDVVGVRLARHGGSLSLGAAPGARPIRESITNSRIDYKFANRLQIRKVPQPNRLSQTMSFQDVGRNNKRQPNRGGFGSAPSSGSRVVVVGEDEDVGSTGYERLSDWIVQYQVSPVRWRVWFRMGSALDHRSQVCAMPFTNLADRFTTSTEKCGFTRKNGKKCGHPQRYICATNSVSPKSTRLFPPCIHI